jgi:hypothetical protein
VSKGAFEEGDDIGNEKDVVENERSGGRAGKVGRRMTRRSAGTRALEEGQGKKRIKREITRKSRDEIMTT